MSKVLLTGAVLGPLLLLVAGGNALLANGLQIDMTPELSPAGHLRVYHDPADGLNLVEVLQSPERFKRRASARPSLGYRKGTVWLKLRLVNPAPTDRKRFVELESTLLDRVDLFCVSGTSPARVSRCGRAGREVPANTKPLSARTPVFPVRFPPGTTLLVFKIRSESSITLAVNIYTPEAYEQAQQRRMVAFGGYYGIMLVMFLYNLMLYFFLRDTDYLYYTGVILFFHVLFQFTLNGFFGIVLPELLGTAKPLTAIFHGLGLACSLEFCRRFTRSRRIAPRWDLAMRIVMVAAALNAAWALWIPYRAATFTMLAIGPAAIICIISTGVIAVRVGMRAVWWYLAAWSGLLVGGLVYVLKLLGVVPAVFVTEYGWQIGSAIEATLLSLALGYRFTILRERRFAARRRAISEKQTALGAQRELLDLLARLEHLSDLTGRHRQAEDATTALLASIQGIAMRTAGAAYAFTLVSTLDGNPHVRTRGPVPTSFLENLPDGAALRQLLEVPPELLPNLNRIFKFGPETFIAPPEEPETRPELRTALNETMQVLAANGFRLGLPLPYEGQIFGYLILGPPENGGEYAPADTRQLEALRLPFAIAIRNTFLYEEIVRLKGRAEQKADRLTGIVIGKLTNARHHKVQERTLVFASKSMEQVVQAVERFAETQQPILISGDTGTGKELLARIAHERRTAGEENKAPFVAINCAAVPAPLWESEIFGTVRGAYTDAKTDRAGRIREAGSGTVFFDEIGEMPLEIQPKLLRLLQERTFSQLGGQEELTAHCAFVFATNRKLEEMVAAGQFREDLFYRIGVLKVQVPALRERPEDIEPLLSFTLEKYRDEVGSLAKSVSPATIEVLLNYDWPGNIREMENVVIYALVQCDGPSIQPDHLPPQVHTSLAGGDLMPGMGLPGDSRTFEARLFEFSRRTIVNAIDECGGNKRRAAEMLGIKRATFYKKLHDLNIL